MKAYYNPYVQTIYSYLLEAATRAAVVSDVTEDNIFSEHFFNCSEAATVVFEYRFS